MRRDIAQASERFWLSECVCVFTCSPMDAVVDRRRQSDLKGESQSDGGEGKAGRQTVP